ncbi:DDE-type integrase/transposase/recombinase [Methylobacterium flocculans]|uniref:DDE-type integrase/transposase/recombinase n=1 Tax=Methylobacterium flocculans TaxID=2984843 RepID=UPI0021F2F4E0|nr:DDE-type integrase/transposase/recombinase [Methylobacterium sp. FF17]
MKLWLTAAEIAELSLPGLPATKRNVNAFAEVSGWNRRDGLWRPRKGVGGGLEYHLDLLPPDARRAYVARLMPDAVPEAVAEAADAEPAATHMRDDAAEARDARLAILAAAERIYTSAKLPRENADLLTVADYTAGRLALPPWVRAKVPTLTLRSLKRWRAAARDGRTAALAVDRGAARRGLGVLDTAEDGQVRVYALALIARQPHLSADHVREMLRTRFGDTLTVIRSGGEVKTVPLPPIRTVQDALRRWKDTEKVALTAITNPDAYKSRFKLAGNNTASNVTRLNEVWQIDASPMDALCVDGRHSVYLAIDVWSRRVVVYVSKTPRAEAVGLLLRRAILAWGVPETVKTDNGSDFTAKASQRLLASLGIEHTLSPAFTPEDKPFVERVVGTFQRDLGPLLPGFIGHSVADRKVIEARRAFSARLGDQDNAKAFCVELTGMDLQGYCDAWAENRYQHRPHAGLRDRPGLRIHTPYGAASAYTGSIRRIGDVRALDLLLAPVAGKDGVRTVGKQGITIERSFYHAPQVMPDTQVFVRMDPADMGRAYLFALDGGEYLGEALCPEILGIDPAEAVALAKAARKALIDERTAEVRREAKAIKPRDFADTILGRVPPAASKVVAFPRPSDAHSTPQLTAAGDVFAEPKAAPTVLQAADAALQAEIEADLGGSAPATNVQPLRRVDTPQFRFRRALDLRERLGRGEVIETADALWLGGYEAGPEFKSQNALYADFGEAAL